MLHGLEAADHGLDARAHLVVALRERGAFGGERFLALAQRAVLFLESVDGDEKFFDAAFEQREFRVEAGFAVLVVVSFMARNYRVPASLDGRRQFDGVSLWRSPWHNSPMLAATYDEFERVLRDARALPEPAEAHGTLAGALCSSRDYGLIEWLREILPDDSPDDEALQSSVLQNVYDSMVRTLVGNEADFEPLLPDDDAPLAERADALSLWCQGFLYGLGSGAARIRRRCPPRRARSSATSPRSRTSASMPASRTKRTRVAFAEVVEFVRVGVQLLFVELAPARGEEPAPGAASIH